MKIGPEKKIQMNIVNWLRQCHPDVIFMANMNENQGTPMWRQIGQKMGVIKGVSDLFFPKGNWTYTGLWLEIKTKEGMASPEQIRFCAMMIDCGYYATISYGFDDSQKIIKTFYELSK